MTLFEQVCMCVCVCEYGLMTDTMNPQPQKLIVLSMANGIPEHHIECHCEKSHLLWTQKHLDYEEVYFAVATQHLTIVYQCVTNMSLNRHNSMLLTRSPGYPLASASTLATLLPFTFSVRNVPLTMAMFPNLSATARVS